MQHLADLNDEQKRAVCHQAGPLLIIAGAGAGKTKTLTSRIIHLIYSGVAPAHILAITFTNKAAQEMRERVMQALPAGTRGEAVHIYTFHAFGVRILRAHATQFSRTKYFSIIDAQAARTLIKEAIKTCHFDPKELDPRRVQQTISRMKNKDENVETFATQADSHFLSAVSEVWRVYENLLHEHNGFDFDDLLTYTLRVLEQPEIRAAYQDRYRYIHIDEYQDTNTVQYQIARQLAGDEQNICVVGDGDQNIYSWRGATIHNILHFERDFPGTTVVTLTQNYRSTKTILQAANAVITKNTLRKEKELQTHNAQGEPIDLYGAATENDEARYLAERIIAYKDAGYRYADIAMLYRTNFQSRVLEEAMLMYSIPYQVLGTRFFDRKEIKDVLGYLEAAYDRTNRLAIKRTINYPKRGIGKVSQAKHFAGKTEELNPRVTKKITAYYTLLERIQAYAQTHTPSEVIAYILDESGIDEALRAGSEEDHERLENCKELVTFATRYDQLPPGDGIAKLLEDAALHSDQDTLAEKDTDSVKLMTVHAAKGLEFPVVCVTGLEQDLFPQKKEGAAKDEQEEERRLFYVALTRAQKKLILTYAQSRMIFGSRGPALPSEFLDDIPPELMSFAEEPERVVYLDI